MSDNLREVVAIACKTLEELWESESIVIDERCTAAESALEQRLLREKIYNRVASLLILAGDEAGDIVRGYFTASLNL